MRNYKFVLPPVRVRMVQLTTAQRVFVWNCFAFRCVMLFGRLGSYNYSAIHSIKFPEVSQRTFKTKGLISIEGTFFWDTLYIINLKRVPAPPLKIYIYIYIHYYWNLSLKTNKFDQELYVNPAKHESAVTVCPPFKEALAVPERVLEEFITLNIVGGIVGVSDAQLDHCCLKCNKCVTTIKAQKIVTCDNVQCQLMQKLERCKKHWYLKVLIKISHDDNMIKMVLQNGSVVKALEINNWGIDPSNLAQEDLCSLYFPLDSVDVLIVSSQ